jgi:hypothetical protein
MLAAQMAELIAGFSFPLWVRFRVFGSLRPGFLKVEALAPRSEPGTVTIFDVWIDELPYEFVPSACRMPNSEFWGLVSDRQTVIETSSRPPSDSLV